MPSSVCSATRESSGKVQHQNSRPALASSLRPQTTELTPMRRLRHIIVHQFMHDHLMTLLSISVVLAACSTVSGPTVSDSAQDLRGSADQKRGSDPEPSQTETPQQPRTVLSRRAESVHGQMVVEIARKYVGTP